MQGQVLKIAYAVSFNHKLAQLRHLPLHQTHFEFEGELPIWNKFCELIAHTYIHSVRNYVLSLSGDNQAFDMKTAFAGASLFKLTWNAELMKSLRTNAGYFFVHFSEGQLRPVACGALSFEGKNVSFLGKKYQFLSYKEFFSVQ